MKLDGGDDTINSWMGSFCSMILFLIITAYTVQKSFVLIDKMDVDVLETNL